MKKLQKTLEDSMAAAGMASGGDLEDAVRMGKKKEKH